MNSAGLLLKRLLRRLGILRDHGIWCLVANIKNAAEKTRIETQRGTKHFAPRTKVYCFPPAWGDGYASIRVIGRRRGSKRYQFLIMPSKHLENWRLQRVYSPTIIRRMQKENGWTGSRTDKKRIRILRDSLLKRPV